MKDYSNWQIQILSAVKHNGNVMNLLDVQHTLDDLMNALQSLEVDNLILEIGGAYVLTDEGETKLNQSQKDKKGIYKYIFEDKMYQTERLDIEAIYIPRKRRAKDN